MKTRAIIKNWLPYARWIFLFGAVLLIVPFLTPYLVSWIGANKELIDVVSNIIKIISGITTILGLGGQYLRGKKNREQNVSPAEEKIEESPSITFPNNIVEARKNIEKLMDWHEYETAVQESEKYLAEVYSKANRNDPGVLLTEMELRVDYSRALMYSGKIPDASKELDNIIKSIEIQYKQLSDIDTLTTKEILGLAHNHKGYISWMEFSRYEHALIEFRIAMTYLQDHPDHLATVSDNMGRIYSQLGYHAEAKIYIQYGLSIRNKSGDHYRKALSRNSLAIAFLAENKPQDAYYWACESYQLFCEVFKGLKDKNQGQGSSKDRQSGVRGMGLASITKGQALRMLGTNWREIADDDIIEKQSMQYLQEALIELGFALIIFKSDKILNDSKINLEIQKRLHEMSIDRLVAEPIRRYQALNELGCTYREIHLIHRTKNRSSQNDREARELLRHKHVVEIGKQSIVHYVDTYEDLARLSYVCNDLNSVIRQVEQIEQEVEKQAEGYLIKNGKLPPLMPVESCYEELWRNLAKLYILRGQTKLKKISLSVEILPGILNAIEDYFQASLFMQRFLQRPVDPMSDINKELYPTNCAPQFFCSLVASHLVNDLNSIINLDARGVEAIECQIEAIYEKYDIPSDDCKSDITNALNILSTLKGRTNKVFKGNTPSSDLRPITV